MGVPSLAGAPMQSWPEKWSEWEIQAVVAFSFLMQVILFLFAGSRRYSISSFLKVFLWLVYLLADIAASYALGHMSASLSKTSTDKHQLVAFWAPFLLLHLGGQDNMTAYALEDNKLWLRHLLTMSVQVAGTGYVLHKYIIGYSRGAIVSAAVLVSVAGFVKYGERIWALRFATQDFFWTNRTTRTPIASAKNCFTRNQKVRNYEFILITAHDYFYDFVKPIIVDRDRGDHTTFSNYIIGIVTGHVDGLLDQSDLFSREKRYAKEVYRVIEVQLALAYNIVYTKGQVMHTWYGYLIRGISFVSCFGALVAFTISKRDGYSTPDVVISFVLLGGACTLEAASAFKVIVSTGTYSMLRRCAWDWLAYAILFARYHLIVVKDGRWSNSVGQYDLIYLCGSESTRPFRGMSCYFRLRDRWSKPHYTKHAKLSPALKEFVWGMLRGEKSDMVQIEDVAIQRGYWARRLTGFNQSEELDWSLRLEFHYCVYIWHIATNTFLSNTAVRSELVDTGMAEAVNTLSDYMMYLLIKHPDILPMSASAHTLFEQTYFRFSERWNRSLVRYTEDRIVDMPHQIILDFETSGVGHADMSWLCGDLTSVEWDVYPGYAVLVKASILVRTLLSMNVKLTHKLVIIGRVWTEILSYAATNASGDFHARQLSNGGEFLTHMLLLTIYCSAMDPIVQVADPGEPTVDIGGHVELNVDTDGEDEITESR